MASGLHSWIQTHVIYSVTVGNFGTYRQSQHHARISAYPALRADVDPLIAAARPLRDRHAAHGRDHLRAILRDPALLVPRLESSADQRAFRW